MEESAAKIQDEGGTALAITSDITDPQAVDELKSKVERQLGSASILVNAAGVFGPLQWVKSSPQDRWIETILTNTVGPYLTSRAFLSGMLEGGWGRIVNFSSAAAFHRPGPLNSAYATSKVALNQFTRHLAAEIAGTGVTANLIHPGDVKTEMWAAIREEVDRLGPDAEAFCQWVEWVDRTGGDDPDKAADLVLKLMSDEAASINGQFLWIEGGLQAPIPSWAEAANTQPWKSR
jgi:NAD(P)-dependent dehydrogenase (short-subunit alcohol dehydrogenase family)